MAYIGKSPSGLGVRTRYYYTATGGETSLSGADDNGRVLKFTDGEYIDVYLNGVLLVAGTDYGTGTANTVSSLDPLSAGNVVEIVAYDIHSLAKPNLEALRKRYYKTATGGETSISGNDDNGAAITFAANAEIEVYLNGVALVQGDDYNTTTANTVGGLAALNADDIVSIVVYEEFTLGDVVSKKSGGTFASDVTFSQDISVGVNATVGGTLTASGNVDVTGDATVTGDLTVDTDTLYVDSTNDRVGIGTSSPNANLGFPIGSDIKISQVAGTAHQAGNAGSIGLTIADGGNDSGVFVNNTHDGTYSDQSITFKTAEGGVSLATERMRITSSGNVLVGTTSTSTSVAGVQHRVAANVGQGYYSKTSSGFYYTIRFYHSGTNIGNIGLSNTGVSYATTSDYRTKENVTDINDGITRVKQLSPKRFNFIDDADATVDGFIAHEAQTVVPEAVSGTHNEVDDDGNPVYQGIDQAKLVPLLTAALQEAITKIEALETENADFETRIAALEAN